MIGRCVAGIFCAVALCFGAAQQWRPARPTLFIVHADWCGPCQRLDRDLAANPDACRALESRYEIRTIAPDPQSDRDKRLLDAARQTMRPEDRDSIPMFFTVIGLTIRVRHVGYDGNLNKLLSSVGVRRPQRPTRRPPVRAPAPTLQRMSPEVAELRDALAAARNRVDDAKVEWEQRQSELESDHTEQIERLQQQLADAMKPAPAPTTPTERMDAVESLFPSDQPAAETPPQTAQPPPMVPDWARTNERAQSTHRPAADFQNLSWLGTVAKVGLAIAAPEISIPAGLVTAGGFALELWRRRRKRRKESAARDERDGFQMPLPRPRDFNEARQLLRLRELEGRHPLHDSLFGQLAEAEIDNDTQSDDPAAAAAAVRLRDRITQRFNDIAPLSTNAEDHQ